MAKVNSDPSYTVFIRLPFPRGDFVDPPPVKWDATKDRALWRVLSKASKNSDVDWAQLAAKFDVTLGFLLQQTAWLYEQQLLQVRAQMRKIGISKASPAPLPSPVPGTVFETAGGETMQKTGAGGVGQNGSHTLTGTCLKFAGPRVPSSLSLRKDQSLPKSEGTTTSFPPRANGPQISRAPSTTTVVQSKNVVRNTISRAVTGTNPRGASSPNPTSRPSTIAVSPVVKQSPQPKPPSSPARSSSSASSSSPDAPVQSRLLHRPRGLSSTERSGQSADADADDDDDDDPEFLPFAAVTDPSATLRGDPRPAKHRTQSHTHTRDQPHKGKSAAHFSNQRSQTSDSSAGSIHLTQARMQRNRLPPSSLSPRRTAELAGRSPGTKGRSTGLMREGSEGSPSMGSSFSDLDDASVTQSALEEALASNLQAGGGMASRMSSISQALRSKYL